MQTSAQITLLAFGFCFLPVCHGEINGNFIWLSSPRVNAHLGDACRRVSENIEGGRKDGREFTSALGLPMK